MTQCKGLTRDCDGERTQRCRLGATIDGYCKLHYPGAQAMSGRSDEEIAIDVLREWHKKGGSRYAALVAAGRAEGDKQGERRGWIEALTWVLELRIPYIRDYIRARLREIEGGK